MELLYQLPEPEDLERDECAASLHGLRDEIKKLQDKYGAQAGPALKEVEAIIKKYETSATEEEKQQRAEKHLLAKHKVRFGFVRFSSGPNGAVSSECGSSNNCSRTKYCSSISQA